MTSPTRALLNRTKVQSRDPVPRLAIPVGRDYAAGLDPDAIRTLDLARLGLDVAIGGPAGTGKSAIVKRIVAMAAPTRHVATFKADGTTRHVGTQGPRLNIVDEAGLAAFDPFDGGEAQTVTTFDMLQTSYLARQPKWGATPAERRAEHVITRHSYRRKSIGGLLSPQEDGGPRTMPGPRRAASKDGEPFRVASAYPDPLSTALTLAAIIMRNGLSNPGISQSVAVARPETMDILKEILTLRPLAFYKIPQFVHPLLIQGSESDIIVLEVAGVDAMRISDPHRWATVAFSRAGYRLDIVMPRRSRALDHASASDALATLLCFPAQLEEREVMDSLTKGLDIALTNTPDGICVRAYPHRGTTHVSRPSMRDLPFESDPSAAIQLGRSDLSKSTRESVILPIAEDIRSLAAPLSSQPRLRRAKRNKPAPQPPKRSKP